MPKAADLDPAITSALFIDPERTKIETHGSSGFSSTAKISTVIDGEGKVYFMKTGKGKDAEIMFRGEHESLNAIHAAVPTFCPKSYAHGQLANSPNTSFLVTDFLDLSSSRSSSTSTASFAQKLARLHTTPAPIPEGHDQPVFGFPVTTCCGSTPQLNGYRTSWAEFFADNRVLAIRKRIKSLHGKDLELEGLITKIAELVVPQLLADGHLTDSKRRPITPVVVHGDLWSGNHGVGKIGEGETEEVVFDASACYGHSEYELGIMRLFGGFGEGFWRDYHDIVPKGEPLGEYEDRIELYKLYHQLNHHAIFGSGYRSGAVSIMKRLLGKYSDRKR